MIDACRLFLYHLQSPSVSCKREPAYFALSFFMTFVVQQKRFIKSDLLSNALFPHTAKARAFGVPLLLRRQTTVRLSTGPNSVRGRGEGKMGNRNSIYSGSRLDLT